MVNARSIPSLALLLVVACGDSAAGTTDSGDATTSTAGGSTSGTTGGSTGGTTGPGETSAPTTGNTTGDPPPDMPPPIQCDPQGGGPYWLLEGETVKVKLSCKTGFQLAGADFAIDPMPTGATYDPATATMTWTPGLDQGAVYNLTITATPYNETGAVKIGVADAWDNPQNVPVVDPNVYTEEYGLPVLFLYPSPDITEQLYTPATVIYRGHTYVAESKLRGAASLYYPKNSYTLKFAQDDKFNEPDLGGGFTDKRKVVLISTFDDNSYVRQRLSYELWNRLDPGHIQVQVYSAVVFLDGQYYGLYTVSDHVSGYLMEEHGLFQDGNLYKARTHDANFRMIRADKSPKATPHDGLTKEEGLPLDGMPGAYDDLDALVKFVATANDTDFLAKIDGMIDRRDYEDWWIFVSLIMADDSAGKNSYHYHDPNATGPWRYVPWDFNDSFGQTWQTARKGFTADPAGYQWANELFARFLKLPTIGDPLRARYGEVLGGLYKVDDVLALTDAMIAETAESARRDEVRWVDQYRNYGGWNWRKDFTTYEQEVVYLRQWIKDRWAFVDGVY